MKIIIVVLLLVCLGCVPHPTFHCQVVTAEQDEQEIDFTVCVHEEQK